MSRRRGLKLVMLGGAAALALQIGVVQVAPAGAAPVPAGSATGKSGGVTSSELQRAIADLSSGRTPSAPVQSAGTLLRVEVVHHLTDGAARQLVEGIGGVVEGSVPRVLLQALVPFDRIATLENSPGIDVVRSPLDVSEPLASEPPTGAEAPVAQVATIVGQEVVKTNASSWQAAGITGSGVKIGIVDSFSSSKWNAAVSAGELVNPSGTFCLYYASNCDIWGFGSDHGEGVAEIIHEMAPDAQLYLATVGTASELQAAVNYFVGQGVRIISRSETARYDGPGDGTGPIASVMNNAVANGVTWFNAAGNAAGVTGSRLGSYWRGSWRDANANGYLDFATGDELMGVNCAFVNGLRWNDWAATGRTDYDVEVYDTVTSTTPEVTSTDIQGGGAFPLEVFTLECGGTDTTDYIKIKLYNAGSGTTGDVLEFMTNGRGLEYWQNPYSAAAPQADTASPGGLAIGAIDPANGTTIASYSSQGPTNDNRIKPDLSVASCVSSYTYAWPGCFNGTSAATPGAAGAAALVLQSGAATTPSTLKTYLLNNATVDRGVSGPDNVYGRGELVLPAPPGPANDLFANATAIPGSSGTTLGSNVRATKETGEPNHAGFTGGASVWYRWTAPTTGYVNIDTGSSSFDTLLGIYTGSRVSALTTITSNDDVSGTDTTSKVRFRATSGTTYRIAVDGYSAATGDVAIRWAMPDTAPIASAGPDQEVQAGSTVTLDGSASLDADGGPLTYRWVQTSGPPAVLNDDRNIRPQFVTSSDKGTTSVFRLTVTDDTGRTAVDDVTIKTK